MPELIDKQKAQTEIALIAKHLAKSDAQKAIIGRILFMLDHMPTIEAEPVRHGRWENGKCTDCKHNLIELCGGEDYELAMYAEFDAEFCPFCGAKMDGGEEDAGTDDKIR